MGAFQAKVQKQGGGDYEIPPAGSQLAIFVAIIDLGTKDYSFQGQVNHQHKVFFVWELVGDEKKTDGKNFIVARDYTFSLNEKSTLRIMLEKVTGKQYKEGDEVDFENWLGKPFILSLVHKESQNEKTYAKIEGVQPVVKGTKAPSPSHKPFAWDFQSGKPIPTEDWIPFVYGTQLKEVIEQSDEWKARGGSTSGNGKNGKAAEAARDEEEIPY